jgi:DHA1 family bicyclomycin/chloramphenicol resistance-like MFS transporter
VEVLWVGRLLQGMAAASGPVIARAMVRDRYQGGEAVRVMSSLAAAMSVVPLVAPVLGGWLLYIGNWRGEFVLLLGFALFTWSGVRGMPETSPAIGLHKPDISAIARQMAMCFGDRCFLGFVVCGGAGFATLFVWITSSAFVITDTFGLPATQFGYFYAPGVVGYALGAHSGSRMLKRWSTLQLLKFSVIVLLCGAVMMQLQADGSAAHAGGVLIATALMAVGVGMLLPLCQMGAISRFDTYAGAASSTFGFSQTLLCALVSVSVAQIKGETLAVMGSLMLVTAVLSACGLVLLVRDQNQRK